MRFLKLFLIIAILAFGNHSVKADVKLADIFSSHMVLQRNMNLKIWGTSNVEEKITIQFNGQKVSTKANNDGKWEVTLKAMKAGGPFEMIVEATNTITLNDILIGDVWVCSGQSNMAWSVKNSNNAAEEIKNANYPNIRIFTVPNQMSTTPITTIDDALWQECSSETIKEFSAVGYFFGREIHLEENVPVGLINSTWGGTCVETWTSKESIIKLPKYEDFASRIDAFDIEKEKEKKREKLRKIIGDFPKKEIGLQEKWMSPETDKKDWLTMELPNLWDDKGLEDLDGLVWFSYNFEIDSKDLGDKIKLNLGAIDDSDMVWVNGVKVGETNWGFNKNRFYSVAERILKEGTNNITIRVQDRRNKGGFSGSAKDFYIDLGNKKQSLAGNWKYKVDQVYDNFDISPNEQPSLLYNGMINPLIPYGIKGVIWYQGENNSRRAIEYATTFPNMITNWRQDWDQGDFPFLFVQLANFGNPNANHTNWAELRESQTKTLSLKNTGMALAVDIGEANDIHPRNKQDVGKRLSLAALKIAYNKEVIYSGPQYKSMKIDDNKAIISFHHIGSGLTTKNDDNEVKEFEIAGKDQKFYKASAKIDGDNIVVWSNEIKKPVAVRFAWANNPSKFNLYNKEGLPAIPFRTDTWIGVTDGKTFDD